MLNAGRCDEPDATGADAVDTAKCEPVEGEVRRRSVAAAVDHLMAGGINRFEYSYVAKRAGLDAALIEEIWPDRSPLLMEAWSSGLGWASRLSDTGSLGGDLSSFAERASSAVGTPEGRMLFRSSVPLDDTPELADVRMEFWDSQFESAADILRRSDRRGELRRDINHLDAVRMFCASMYFDPLYLDAEIPSGYLDGATDIFLRGVAKNPQPASEQMRREVMLRVGTREQDLLGEEMPAVIFQSATTAKIREVVLDAAIKEATLRGPEFVTINVIAQRAGVTTQVVERMWKTDADLLRDAGARARSKTRQIRDTGDLSADLTSFAEDKANLISTADARRNFLSVIPHDSTARNSAAVMEFWSAGLRESTKMLLRAQDRGELRNGVNPDWATRAVVVALYYDLFFTNHPMRPDYTAQTLDIFLNGVTRRPELSVERDTHQAAVVVEAVGDAAAAQVVDELIHRPVR